MPATNDDTANDARTVKIPVESGTRDKLRAQKIGGETYDDVVTRLLSGGSA